jgi:hypothetical protein
MAQRTRYMVPMERTVELGVLKKYDVPDALEAVGCREEKRFLRERA